MKKLLSIMLVIVMMFPAAACAGSKDEPEEAIEPGTNKNEPAENAQTETYADDVPQYDTGMASGKEYTAGNGLVFEYRK